MSAAASNPAVDRARLDPRGYWRVLLALCAPTGWLTVGVVNLLTPYPLGGTTAQNVAGIDAHPHRMVALIDVYPLFAFTFVPGVLALVVVCRRAKPVFTAALGTLGILGALAATFNPPADLIIVMGLREGVDHDRLIALIDAIGTSAAGWTLLFTLLFITIGRIAVGVLLWKASVGPRALAVAMIAAPFVEFGGMALGAGNAAPAIAWLLSGIGMLGVSAALLRMSNDEFDPLLAELADPAGDITQAAG